MLRRVTDYDRRPLKGFSLVNEEADVLDTSGTHGAEDFENTSVVGMGVGVDVDLSLGTLAQCFTNFGSQLIRGDFVIPQPDVAVPLNCNHHRVFSNCSPHRYGVRNLCQTRA